MLKELLEDGAGVGRPSISRVGSGFSGVVPAAAAATVEAGAATKDEACKAMRSADLVR